MEEIDILHTFALFRKIIAMVWKRFGFQMKHLSLTFTNLKKISVSIPTRIVVFNETIFLSWKKNDEDEEIDIISALKELNIDESPINDINNNEEEKNGMLHNPNQA